MSHDAYVRRARLLRVVDGDTVHLTVDLGYRRYSDEVVRLLGVDTPEINSGTDEEKARGQKARDYALWWCARAGNGEWPLHVQSHKSDTFGRWLGVVTDSNGSSLGGALVEAGLAVEWTGRRA